MRSHVRARFLVGVVFGTWIGVLAVSGFPSISLELPDKRRSFSHSVRAVGEAAKWPSIDGQYTSVYKYQGNPSCPDKIDIHDTVLQDRLGRVSTTNHTDIIEDDTRCDDKGVAYSLDIAFLTSEEGAAYVSMNHKDLNTRLNANGNAKNSLQTFTGARLGFDEWPAGVSRSRKCNQAQYEESTFWFHILGGSGNKVVISMSGGQTDTILFPENTKGIFLMGSNARLCILQVPEVADAVTTAPPAVTTQLQTTATIQPTTAAPASTSAAGTVAQEQAGSGDGTLSSSTATATTTTLAPLSSTTQLASNASSTVATAADDGSACFPGSAIVEKADGTEIPLHALRVGELIRTGPESFSEVFQFTHKIPEYMGTFLRITTGSGFSLRITPGHFLYLNGELVEARYANIGDKVRLGSGELDVIQGVETMSGRGLYNPQTLDGDVIVDNVLTSTYTSTVQPQLAHALLLPFRVFFRKLGYHTEVFEAGLDPVPAVLRHFVGLGSTAKV